ncbi:MAG: hypothetical protein ABI651_13295 [Verrucomicrobiota bacterium]
MFACSTAAIIATSWLRILGVATAVFVVAEMEKLCGSAAAATTVRYQNERQAIAGG